MKIRACACGCVAAVVVLASQSQGAVIPTSRLTSMDIYILCGNGPALETYDETIVETGLFSSGVFTHDKFVLFSDAVWGSSDADVRMSQDIEIVGNGTDGFRIDGALDPNSIGLRSLAPSVHGADALANARTNSVFEYVFQVTGAPVPWSLSIDATRNPTGGFAASLQNLSGGGYSYLSPLADPISDFAEGFLAPGEYRLLVRQNTNGLTTTEDLLDLSTAEFVFAVGEVPTPGATALGLFAAVGSLRRRR